MFRYTQPVEPRYSRQIQLEVISQHGQEKLSSSRVLIVGVGGLGCASALYLASAGIGKLRLVDDDHVSETDLARQILYGPDDVGKSKVEVAAQRLRGLNPHVEIDAIDHDLVVSNFPTLLHDVDLIIDGTDQLEPRALANRAFLKRGIPVVFAGAAGFNAFVMTCAGESPCFDCVWTEPPHHSCNEIGILGPVVGMAGACQAAEAILTLVGPRAPLGSKLLLIDSLRGEFRTVAIHRRAGCVSCLLRAKKNPLDS